MFSVNSTMLEVNLSPPEAYSVSCQTSQMELSVTLINHFQSLTIFGKSSILDVCQGTKYVSVQCR